MTAAATEYVYNPEFDDPAREATILGPVPGRAVARLLTRGQEVHLFRKMNYLKHRLAGGAEPAAWLRAAARAVRDDLVERNQGLVYALAGRNRRPGLPADELVSDANLALFRAVERFDYARGFRFSTYATWAVLRAFGRTVPAAAARHRLFRSGADEALAAWPDERPAEAEQVAGAAAARERVAELLARLDSRTRAVVRMRAGLDGEQTSVRIGEHFGVSPERVRQIYLRGLNRLRELAGSVAGA